MKILLVIACICCACDERLELRQEVAALVIQRDQLQAQIHTAATERDLLVKAIESLKTDSTVMSALRDHGDVRFVLRLSIRTVSYSLSLRRQLSDAVNEEEFDIFVDRRTYENAQAGTNLFDAFKAGSAIFKGRLSSWRIRIVSKRIET